MMIHKECLQRWVRDVCKDGKMQRCPCFPSTQKHGWRGNTDTKDLVQDYYFFIPSILFHYSKYADVIYVYMVWFSICMIYESCRSKRVYKHWSKMHLYKLMLSIETVLSLWKRVTDYQSIKIYIAPLQDPYSEALPTQAKQKRTVLRRWWNWEQASFGRCLRSTGSPF